LEKKIKISTQGRLTIPKQIRDIMKISEGQPILVRTSDSSKNEIIIQLLPKLTDFK